MAKRRLAILRHAEEITGNVALTCRYYGISRQIFSTWKRRYNAHGLDGLRDRSHRPQVSPNATRAWSKSSLPSQLRTARVVADIFKPAAARARLPAGGGSMTFATPARACSSPSRTPTPRPSRTHDGPRVVRRCFENAKEQISDLLPLVEVGRLELLRQRPEIGCSVARKPL